jgi:hypothetical protein
MACPLVEELSTAQHSSDLNYLGGSSNTFLRQLMCNLEQLVLKGSQSSLVGLEQI